MRKTDDCRPLLPPGDVAHVWQMVRDALVAIDAGFLTRKQEASVSLNCTRALTCKIHRICAVAVTAFERVIGLHPATIRAPPVQGDDRGTSHGY